MARRRNYKNTTSKVRIENRRLKIAEMTLAGKSQPQIAEALGCSQPLVCTELKNIVEEWRKEYADTIDTAKAVEFHRCVKVLDMCMEEFEKTKLRKVYAKDPVTGKIDYKKPPVALIDVVGDSAWMARIQDCLKELCKIRGVYTENKTTNNLNIFSFDALVKAIKDAQTSMQPSSEDRLMEVERLQEQMEKAPNLLDRLEARRELEKKGEER